MVEGATEVLVFADDQAMIQFGTEEVRKALQEKGIKARISTRLGDRPIKGGIAIINGREFVDLNLLKGTASVISILPEQEGYVITGLEDFLLVAGSDDRGTMYGALELADLIAQRGYPLKINRIREAPKFPLRMYWIWNPVPAEAYNAKATQEAIKKYFDSNDWPFFNKEAWQDLLDELSRARFNALCLFSGHPFPWMIRFEKFPEARVIPEPEIERWIGMWQWIFRAAKDRGIAVIIQWQNIHVSVPFKQTHHLEGGRPGVPDEFKISAAKWSELTEEYTISAIEELLELYPDLGGLCPTPGEDVETPDGRRNGSAGIEWCRKVMLHPVAESGRKDLLVMIRAWDANPDNLNEDIAHHPSLYEGGIWVPVKHSNDSIKSAYPDKVSIDWSQQGNPEVVKTIDSVWNRGLRPFMWCDPEMVKEMVLNAKEIGHQGMAVFHLGMEYFPASYDTIGDHHKFSSRRHWLYTRIWGLSMWDADKYDKDYWIGLLERYYGSKESAEFLYLSMAHLGDMLPRISRQFYVEYTRPQFGFEHFTPLHSIIDLALMPTRDYRSEYSQPPTYAPLALWYKPGDYEGFSELRYPQVLSSCKSPVHALEEVSADAQKAFQEAKEAGRWVRKNSEHYECYLMDLESISSIACYWEKKGKAAIELLRLANGEGSPGQILTYMEEAVRHYDKFTRIVSRHYVQPLVAGDELPRDLSKYAAAARYELEIFKKLLLTGDYKRIIIGEDKLKKSYSLVPLGFEVENYCCLDLSSLLTHEVPDIGTVEGKKWEVGGIPFFTWARQIEGEVEIPLGGSFDQAHFLQATSSTLNNRKEGENIGSYEIVYQDNSREEIPLVIGKNIDDLRLLTWIMDGPVWEDLAHLPASLTLSEARSLFLSARLWLGSLPVVALFYWENPYPRKPVKKIIIRRASKKSNVLLIGVTLENYQRVIDNPTQYTP